MSHGKYDYRCAEIRGMWHDIKKRKPECYVLVKVEFDSGYEKNGWWNGTYWDFGRPPPSGAKPVRWARLSESFGAIGATALKSTTR